MSLKFDPFRNADPNCIHPSINDYELLKLCHEYENTLEELGFPRNGTRKLYPNEIEYYLHNKNYILKFILKNNYDLWLEQHKRIIEYGERRRIQEDTQKLMDFYDTLDRMEKKKARQEKISIIIFWSILLISFIASMCYAIYKQTHPELPPL